MTTQAIFRVTHLLALCVRNVALIGALAIMSKDVFADDELLSVDEVAGWNLFSVEQDIQLGNESAKRFEASIQLSQNTTLNGYFGRLGNHLVSMLPQVDFPFSFKLIADESLDAFSFPGGHVYCTSGLMAAADSEAQLAGLVTHHIAHIILRDVTSIASLTKRFRVRGAMAAAATGKKSLLDSLEEIDLYLVPGSELMHFDIETEQKATELAANLMAKAGYPPTTVSTFSQTLQTNHKQQATTYLTRHPSLSNNESKITRDLGGKSFQLLSKRKFKNLRKQAKSIRAENRHLDAWVNWQPPDQDPVTPADTREIFLTNRYSFSYPATWRQTYSSDSDKVRIAPKGSAIRSARGESSVTLGVIAGTRDLETQTLPGKESLLEIITATRPGLTATTKPKIMTIDSRPLELMTLHGPSPIPGENETVWMISTNLTNRMFYLLFIAPEDKFIRMEPEFNAILASIRFYGHPDNGHTDERSQEGTILRPQPIE